MNNTKTKHYFMAAGEVYFYPEGKPEDLGTSQVNAVFTTENGKVTVKDLGVAQQHMQLQVTNKLPETEAVEFVNVVFSSIFPLGEMTPAEFHNHPDSQLNG